MSSSRFASLSIALGLSLAGCPGSPGTTTDAGGGADAPEAVDTGAVDAPPAADAPALADAGTDARVAADAGQPGDAGEASVRWTTEVAPVTIDSDIALDYFYQYEVVLVGDPLAYGLTLERCIHVAGATETCETSPRDALTSPSGIRWGIDPSMYAVGENRYRFTLSLDRDGTVVDTDVIELVATVTSCSMCGGT